MTCDGVDLSESSNLVKQMTFWSLDSNPWNCGSSGTDRYFNILSFSYDFNGFQINKLTIADYHLPIDCFEYSSQRSWNADDYWRVLIFCSFGRWRLWQWVMFQPCIIFIEGLNKYTSWTGGRVFSHIVYITCSHFSPGGWMSRRQTVGAWWGKRSGHRWFILKFYVPDKVFPSGSVVWLCRIHFKVGLFLLWELVLCQVLLASPVFRMCHSRTPATVE